MLPVPSPGASSVLDYSADCNLLHSKGEQMQSRIHAS